MIEKAGKAQPLEIEDEMNIHIRRQIEMAVEKSADEVESMRRDLRERLSHFNNSMRLKIVSTDRDDELGKRLSNLTIRNLYARHRREIEEKYRDDDLLVVFAVLYEVTYFKSRERSYWDPSKPPYVFAWGVGHDYLTRIIADGDAQSRGIGIAPTVSRGRERSVFGRNRR